MSSPYSYVVEKRSAKESPLPKSPFPKSPVLYEKYKSRCAYGLFGLFHSGQSHSKKLIYESRYDLGKNGDGSARNRLDLLSSEDEKCQCVDDGVDHKTVTVGSGKAEVKLKEDVKLIKKNVTTAKGEHGKPSSVHDSDLSRNNRKETKTRRRPLRMPMYGCYDVATIGNCKQVHENLVERSSKKLEPAATSEMLSNQVHPENVKDCNGRVKDDQINEISLQVNLNEATEAFINQKLIDAEHLGGNGAVDQSKCFLDALEVLNSNKDLFIKLLQDPNSLLVKHIEDLRDSQAKKQHCKVLAEAKLSDMHTTDEEECKEAVCNRNFERSNRHLSKETDDTQSLEQIVVLCPGRTHIHNSSDGASQDPASFHFRMRNVQQSVRPTFFPFERMKRKLMNAMGLTRKEQQLMSPDGAAQKSIYSFLEASGSSDETGKEVFEGNSCHNFGRVAPSSVNDNRKDLIKKATELESRVAEKGTTSSESIHRSSNMSVTRHSKRSNYEMTDESRIHPSQLLNNGNANLLTERRPKTWDGIMSVPEDGLLPVVSPRGKREREFVAPQMRFSPHNCGTTVRKDKWMNRSDKRNSCLSPLRQNVEAPPWPDNQKHVDQLQMIETELNDSDNSLDGVQDHESIRSRSNDPIASEIEGVKSSESGLSEAALPCQDEGSRHSSTNQSTDTVEDNESSNFLRTDLPAENQRSKCSVDGPSSSPSSIRSLEDFDKADQPSPVSVLESFFIEEATSPLSTKPASPESLVQSLQVGNEDNLLAGLVHFPADPKHTPTINVEERGSISDFISRVLQVCGFNLDELSLKCLASDQLLDRSLYAEVDLRSNNQSYSDHRLLLDYVNEVLLDVCESHSRLSPYLSAIKPNIRLVTGGTGGTADEVLRHVDWNLLLQPPLQKMDQLLERELVKSRTWISAHIDAESILSEMVESIVEDLIEETAN